jgi:hypothetical protein
LSAMTGSAHGSSTPRSLATDRTIGSVVSLPSFFASRSDLMSSLGSLPGSGAAVSPMAAPPLQLERPRTRLLSGMPKPNNTLMALSGMQISSLLVNLLLLLKLF